MGNMSKMLELAMLYSRELPGYSHQTKRYWRLIEF